MSPIPFLGLPKKWIENNIGIVDENGCSQWSLWAIDFPSFLSLPNLWTSLTVNSMERGKMSFTLGLSASFGHHSIHKICYYDCFRPKRKDNFSVSLLFSLLFLLPFFDCLSFDSFSHFYSLQ